jgi:hypothetical protein
MYYLAILTDQIVRDVTAKWVGGGGGVHNCFGSFLTRMSRARASITPIPIMRIHSVICHWRTEVGAGAFFALLRSRAQSQKKERESAEKKARAQKKPGSRC